MPKDITTFTALIVFLTFIAIAFFLKFKFRQIDKGIKQHWLDYTPSKFLTSLLIILLFCASVADSLSRFGPHETFWPYLFWIPGSTQTTEGTVESISDSKVTACNYLKNYRFNDCLHIFEIRYSFKIGDITLAGRSYSYKTLPTINSKVAIVYLVADPAVSKVDGTRYGPGGGFMSASPFFKWGIIGLFSYFILLLKWRHDSRSKLEI